MPYYTVTLEDRIYCSGTIRVEADNIAEAAIKAKGLASDGNVTMSPMDGGEEGSRVYRIKDQAGDVVAILGQEGFGMSPCHDCLTNHIDALLETEGLDPEDFDYEDDLATFY